MTLGDNITLEAPVTVPQGVTLDGANKTLMAAESFSGNYVVLASGKLINMTVDANQKVKYAVQA